MYMKIAISCNKIRTKKTWCCPFLQIKIKRFGWCMPFYISICFAFDSFSGRLACNALVSASEVTSSEFDSSIVLHYHFFCQCLQFFVKQKKLDLQMRTKRPGSLKKIFMSDGVFSTASAVVAEVTSMKV